MLKLCPYNWSLYSKLEETLLSPLQGFFLISIRLFICPVVRIGGKRGLLCTKTKKDQGCRINLLKGAPSTSAAELPDPHSRGRFTKMPDMSIDDVISGPSMWQRCV